MSIDTTNSKYSNSTKLSHIKSFWPCFLAYTQYIQQNSNSTDINLTEEINNDITKFSKILTEFSLLRTFSFRISAGKYFSKNPNALQNTYSTIIEKSEKDPKYFQSFRPTHTKYNPDFFRTQFVAEVVYETRNIQQGIPNNEFDFLKTTIPSLTTYFEKNIKKIYIQLLVELGNFLKKFDILEKATTTFKYSFSVYQLKDLSYPPHTDEKNCISMDNLFTENFLQNLSMPKLISLTAFWTNRTAKYIEDLNQILYIVNELDLWKKVQKHKKVLPIDDEKLIYMLNKTENLIKMEMKIFEETIITHNTSETELSYAEINEIFAEKLNKKIEQTETRHKIKYDKVLPNSDNLLTDDVDALHTLTNTEFLLYNLKDISIFNLLMGCIENRYSKNWGVIPDSDPLFANVSIDIEGLNMPVRLHIYKSKLAEFLIDFTGKPIIPIYKGSKDMIIRGQYMSSTVLAPLFTKQTAAINQALSGSQNLSPDLVNFLRHIKFLKNPSNPPPALKNEPSNTINIITNEISPVIEKKK